MNLERNVSSNERTIRLVAGIVLMTIAIAGLGLGSFFGLLFGLVGAVLTGTSIVSFCPVYQKLGMNSFRS